MPGGTFRITPPISVVGQPRYVYAVPPNSSSGWAKLVPGPIYTNTDPALIAAVIASPPGVFLNYNGPDGGNPVHNNGILFSNNLTDANIILSDPPSVVSFNGLPSGFKLTSARLTLEIGRMELVTSGTDPANGNFDLILGTDTTPFSFAYPADDNPAILDGMFVDFDMSTHPTMLDLMNSSWGVSDIDFVGASLPGSHVSLEINPFTLSGTYTLENFSYYIKPTIKPLNGKNVRFIADAATDIITINPGDPVPDGFELFGPDAPVEHWYRPDDDSTEEFMLALIDPTYDGFGGIPWIDLGTDEPVCDECVSIELGTLTVLQADASGIYELSPTKRNDSLYVRTGFSTFVDAIEVKIPNPAVRTGFVP